MATSQRHSWSDKVAFEHHSDRVCWNCMLVRRTRHDGGTHWTEWWRDDERILSKATPPCPGKPSSSTVQTQGETHASHH